MTTSTGWPAGTPTRRQKSVALVVAVAASVTSASAVAHLGQDPTGEPCRSIDVTVLDTPPDRAGIDQASRLIELRVTSSMTGFGGPVVVVDTDGRVAVRERADASGVATFRGGRLDPATVADLERCLGGEGFAAAARGELDEVAEPFGREPSRDPGGDAVNRAEIPAETP